MSVPLITALKRNSLDDGPGIRTTVFFKGCPLRCVWCQNPETKRSAQQISYEAQDCTGCQSCVQACRNNAVLIQADGSFPINQHNCTLSGVLADASVQFRDTGAGYLPVCSREDSAPCAGLCVHACPSEALRFTGKTYSEDELVKSLLKDVVFYKNSGGGVTFSGGEPTLFLAFVSGLAARLKAEGIHLCLETCGSYQRESFEQQLLPCPALPAGAIDQ